MNRLFRWLGMVFLFGASCGNAQQPVSNPFAEEENRAKREMATAGGMPTRSYHTGPDFFTSNAVIAPAGAPIPDPFAPSGELAALPNGGWKSSREVLAEQGIPFPEGAMSAFDAVSCVLTVRNTPANLAMLDDWILGDSHDNSVPKMISFTAHVIEAPGPVLRTMASGLTKKSDHTAELTRLLEAASAQRESVRVLETMFLESKSGQQCSIVSQREFVFSSDVRLDAKGRATVVPDMRPLGLGVELEPTVNEDGKTIDINIAPHYSPVKPEVRQETLKVPVTGGPLEMPVTDFYEKTMVTSYRAVSGAARMLGVWKAHRSADPDSQDVALALFLTGHIVRLPIGPAVLPSAQIELPKRSDELQTRTFDVPLDLPFWWTPSLDTHNGDSNILKHSGIVMPKGAAVKVEAPGKLVVTNTVENLDRVGLLVREAWEALPRTVALDVQIIEASAEMVRPLLIEAAQLSDHATMLAKMNEAVEKGTAQCLDALYLESKSGQQASIRSILDRQSVGEVSWSHSSHPAVSTNVRGAGIKLEFEPNLSSHGTILDLLYALEYHPTVFTTRRETFLEPAFNRRFDIPRDDFNVAKVTTSITLMKGATKIIGVWKPVGDDLMKADVLQVTFLKCNVVRHEPKAREPFVGEREPTRQPSEDAHQLIRVTYRISPDFLSVGSESVNQSGKRLLAQEILEAQGISFPEGAYAVVNKMVPRLTVNNTRANLELIEEFMQSIGDFDPQQCAMTVHLFEGNAAFLRKLVSSASDRSDHREELDQLRALTKPIGIMYVATKSGQQVMTEDVKEVTYFTGSSVDEKGNPVVKREMVPVGLRFEVEPTIGADGFTLDLNSSLHHHPVAPFPHTEDLSHPGSGEGSIEVPLMDFYRAEIKSSITLNSGTARILGLWKPVRGPVLAEQDVLQIAILDAEIVPLETDKK